MLSSEQKETRVYYRNITVCFVAVVVGVFCDVQEYRKIGNVVLDWEFFLSLIVYVVLVLLAVYSIHKLRKIHKEKGKVKKGD